MGNILIFILVGLIAGFLASRVVLGKGRGWFWDIVIGILGAVLHLHRDETSEQLYGPGRRREDESNMERLRAVLPGRSAAWLQANSRRRCRPSTSARS